MNASDIRALQASLGLSNADFAVRLGASERSVNNWKSGERKPRGKYLHALGILLKEVALID